MNKGKLTTLLSNTALVPSLAVVFGTVATYFGLNIDQTTLITILGFIVGLVIAYFDIDNPEYAEPKKIEVTTDELSDAIKTASKEVETETEETDDVVDEDDQQ